MLSIANLSQSVSLLQQRHLSILASSVNCFHKIFNKSTAAAALSKSSELQPVSRSNRAPPANATAVRGMPGALAHLYYRPLERRDLDQLHELHKEWFVCTRG